MIALLLSLVFSLAGKESPQEKRIRHPYQFSCSCPLNSVVFSSMKVTEFLWRHPLGLGGYDERKKGSCKCSHSLRYPSHCHTVCLQVPLSQSNSFPGSFCHSISLPPSLQEVVLCRWFTHLNFYHSSKFKRNQMVSCDCLKHHSYKEITNIGFFFNPKKLCFSTCQHPAEGILPSQMQQKGSEMPAVSSVDNCALWLK